MRRWIALISNSLFYYFFYIYIYFPHQRFCEWCDWLLKTTGCFFFFFFTYLFIYLTTVGKLTEVMWGRKGWEWCAVRGRGLLWNQYHCDKDLSLVAWGAHFNCQAKPTLWQQDGIYGQKTLSRGQNKSSTIFVHRGCQNQHKTRVPPRCFNLIWCASS